MLRTQGCAGRACANVSLRYPPFRLFRSFRGLRKGGFSKRVVLADVLPRNDDQHEGTFRCSPGTETGTRVPSHVLPEGKPERGHIRQNHPFTKPPFPKSPPVLKILWRVNFGTGSKFGTDVARRYGDGSEVLVFLEKKTMENGTDTEKLR